MSTLGLKQMHGPLSADFEEATVAFETAGQVVPIAFTNAAMPWGDEPFFTYSESLETARGIDLADAFVAAFDDSHERTLHVSADINDVDVGTGAVEGQDFVDFALYVDGVQVATSEEGPIDAADISATEFTFDVLVDIEPGAVFNFVALSAGAVNEEFTVVLEAAEGDITISRS